MEYFDCPTLRQLLDDAPVNFDDRVFIKYLRGEEIIEKRFSKVRSDALAFCRFLRDKCPENAHIAIISKSSYEYIISLTGIIISGNVAVPMAPETDAQNVSELCKVADISVTKTSSRTGSERFWTPAIRKFRR